MRLRYPSSETSAPVVSLRPAIVTTSLAVLLLGCHQDEVSHYRAPKEPTAPVTQPPRPTGQGTLKWTLPQGWIEGEGGGMRYATLQPPIPGKVEATVVVLAGPAGGELSNVNRWRGQIGLGPIDEKALAAARKTVSSKAGSVAVFDFTSEGQVKSRMVAGLLSTPDGNTWFLKLAGDEGPVGKAQPDFLRLLGSLRLD